MKLNPGTLSRTAQSLACSWHNTWLRRAGLQHFYRHPDSAPLSPWLRKTHLHGNISARGVCCLVSAPSAWYSCARRSHPELGRPTLALALTGCLGLNEVAGSGTWVPYLKLGECVPVCRELLWGCGMLCVLPGTLARGH